MSNFTIDAQTTIHQVVLKVLDLQSQIDFYEQVVGLTLASKTENSALLATAQDGEIIIELHSTAEKNQPAKGTGLFHLALLLPSRKAFATKFFDIIRSKKVINSPEEQAVHFPHTEKILPIARLDRASDHGYSEAFYIFDIEGNGIEFYADRPQQEWSSYPSGSEPLNIAELAAIADYTSDGKLPSTTTIGHIHLRVDKIEETVYFYHEVLGFEKKQVLEDVFFVSAGDYHHHIAGNTWSGENIAYPLGIHTGLKNIKIKLPTEEAYEQLKNHVKQFIPMQDIGDCFIVEDPSKNQIMFIKD
ncbi:VOC family protein [Kurthia sibirica]|uniref:Glyoxalase n=1 Tax=Kurthia sibirica TaxID=202750 RepID=A0A2U3AQK4_9BACL|nr:VOC family protein [Kurthia sibirica]PWI26840.1 glyoxalase [Kurthia sibirica]GEK32622.1 glyoxalase [Kurthia sibirica]